MPKIKIKSRPKRVPFNKNEVLFIRNVPKSTRDKFRDIAKRKGLTQYELFSQVVDSIE